MSDREKGKVSVDRPLSVWYQNPQQWWCWCHRFLMRRLPVFSLVMGLGWAKFEDEISFTCPSVNTMFKACNRRDKIFTVFAKEELVLFWLHCFHIGHLVVSVHDRLLTRKNRKLTYRKRKFKVNPRGSPVNSLHCTSGKHTHTWMLPLVFEQAYRINL